MAITTSVTVGPSQNGSVVVTSGQLEGYAGRQITLEAQPAPGYRFARWEVQTTPVQLTEFAVVASQPVQSETEVCGTAPGGSSPYQNVAVQLYSDGSMLYMDPDGNTPAPTGYWGAGGGTYYLWTGGRLPTLKTCSYSTSGTGTSGGTLCYDNFGNVVSCSGDSYNGGRTLFT